MHLLYFRGKGGLEYIVLTEAPRREWDGLARPHHTLHLVVTVEGEPEDLGQLPTDLPLETLV